MKNPNEKETRKSIFQVEFDLFIFLFGLTVSSIILLADFYFRSSFQSPEAKLGSRNSAGTKAVLYSEYRHTGQVDL